MRRRVTRDEVAEATRSIGGISARGNWWVCDGYQIQGEEIVSDYPAPESITQHGSAAVEMLSHWKVYDPLDEAPDLFLKIASLYEEPDFPAAALAFCRKYGVPGGSSVETGGSPGVTSIPLFHREAKRARDLLELYEATINEDYDTVLSFRSAPPAAWREYFEKRSLGMVFMGRDVLDHAVTTRDGRHFVRWTTLYLVGKAVEHSLRELCYLTAAPTTDDLHLEDPPRLESRWQFDNLLGAAYLQMHWLMTSGDALARCDYCGRVLSLARPYPEGRKRRRDKRFCDDACRQAHHRSKKKS